MSLLLSIDEYAAAQGWDVERGLHFRRYSRDLSWIEVTLTNRKSIATVQVKIHGSALIEMIGREKAQRVKSLLTVKP